MTQIRGLAAMPGYRLYCLDYGNKITRVEEITAMGDEEAIMVARAFKKPVRCELWNRDRHVADIPPFSLQKR